MPERVDETPGKAWLLGVKLGDPHPCDEPSGWPEFELTLSFYVSSDDPVVIERERRRVFDALPDAIDHVGLLETHPAARSGIGPLTAEGASSAEAATHAQRLKP